jgi:zinc/manganese transport system substrate-binding protein
MAVRGTARDVGNGVGDVRDAEWSARRREKFNNRLAPRGISLVDTAQVNLDEFVKFLMRGVDMGALGLGMHGRPVLLILHSLNCNETQSQSTLFSMTWCRPHISARILLVVALATGFALTTFATRAASAGTRSSLIVAIGAENEYANVLSQIGGKYVSVSAILKNPNTDPHAFEASASVAEEVARAQLIVQNGVGYDSFMNNVEAASPNSKRKVIVVQDVLGLPTSTPNPHLWYKPTTMPAVAKVMVKDLDKLAPSHAAYFAQNLTTFDASLKPWLSAIDAFKTTYPGTPVAVTEPVADYLLQAMGAKILTPFVFQADIMNGVDPAPEDITLEEGYFTKREVKLFCYNQQVVDSLTASIRQTAKSAHVPVVGVYETMPTPGFDYQTWMLAETKAIGAAVSSHRSTLKL